MKITITKMDADTIKWHSVKPNSYELSFDGGWFPAKVLMPVVNGKFTDGYNLGAVISGTMGSANLAVTDVNKAETLLINAGYEIEYIRL